ncbi:hypothetical protein C8J57DRAFT_1230236 [Mycena rebaudengoi]|nr:hypothetical protein C8J57DRAFT_1230236 [Mycena rebaudengoi]
MLTKLINRVIQSGAATVVCAAIDLGFFIGQPTTNTHFVPYTNSLMLTLNLRRPNGANNSDSLPMNSVKSQPTGRSQGVQIERSTYCGADTTHVDSKWMPEEEHRVVNVRGINAPPQRQRSRLLRSMSLTQLCLTTDCRFV